MNEGLGSRDGKDICLSGSSFTSDLVWSNARFRFGLVFNFSLAGCWLVSCFSPGSWFGLISFVFGGLPRPCSSIPLFGILECNSRLGVCLAIRCLAST